MAVLVNLEPLEVHFLLVHLGLLESLLVLPLLVLEHLGLL